jgi:hypothetical protein
MLWNRPQPWKDPRGTDSSTYFKQLTVEGSLRRIAHTRPRKGETSTWQQATKIWPNKRSSKQLIQWRIRLRRATHAQCYKEWRKRYPALLASTKQYSYYVEQSLQRDDKKKYIQTSKTCNLYRSMKERKLGIADSWKWRKGTRQNFWMKTFQVFNRNADKRKDEDLDKNLLNLWDQDGKR